VPDLALRAERAANGAGARALGFREVDALGAPAEASEALLVVDDALAWVEPAVLDRYAAIVQVGTALPEEVAARAAVALPMATVLEEEGTLTNLRGRVQRFLQAKAPPGVARPSWYVLADLLAALGGAGDYLVPEAVFDALAAAHPPFTGLSYATLGLQGAPLALPAEVGA